MSPAVCASPCRPLDPHEYLVDSAARPEVAAAWRRTRLCLVPARVQLITSSPDTPAVVVGTICVLHGPARDQYQMARSTRGDDYQDVAASGRSAGRRISAELVRSAAQPQARTADLRHQRRARVLDERRDATSFRRSEPCGCRAASCTKRARVATFRCARCTSTIPRTRPAASVHHDRSLGAAARADRRSDAHPGRIRLRFA